MSTVNDLTVEADKKHGWSVYDLVRFNRLQSRKGAILGHIKRLRDGTYEPSGMGAMFGYPGPAKSFNEARSLCRLGLLQGELGPGVSRGWYSPTTRKDG